MSDPALTPDTIAIVPPTVGSTNRGEDIRITSNDPPQVTVTLDMINGVLLDYFRERIIPTIVVNDASVQVPIIYGDPERWKAVRQDGVLRDPANQKLQAPLIMIRRKTVQKGQILNPNNKYLYRVLDSGWNNRNAYDQFAVLNNIRPSRKFRNVIIPDYMDLVYEVILWTDRQDEMDMLIEQINVESDEYWGERNNFKFRVTIQSFDSQNELPDTKDRTVRSEFEMKVGAYLLPERMLRNLKLSSTNTESFTPKKIIISENIVSKIPKT